MEPMSPALAGGFLTTGPPGKSHTLLISRICVVFSEPVVQAFPLSALFKYFCHNYTFSALYDLRISSSSPLKIYVMIQIEIALNVWVNLGEVSVFLFLFSPSVCLPKVTSFYSGTFHVFLLIQVFYAFWLCFPS